MGPGYDGLTLMIVFGRWGGIHAGKSDTSIHFTVGWVSFQIWFVDIDRRIKCLFDQRDQAWKDAGRFQKLLSEKENSHY